MPRIGKQVAVAAIALLTVAGCASMQTQVTSFSGDYSIAMEQFQNREIITNILRARDRMPLHFAELSQINGSLQEQIQIGSTIPFGKYVGLAKKENDFSPQLQFSSSPTFTTSPLDTQAFAVGMLQPIDPSYFARYWAQGRLPKELLFRLFIDSIRNADGAPLPGPQGNLHNYADPISASEKESFKNFQIYMQTLLEHGADFQTMTVLTPFGEPFQFDTTPAVTGGPAVYKMTDILSAADESTVHLGKLNGHNMLFRRWDDQLVLCYHKTPQAAAFVPEDIKSEVDIANSRIAMILDPNFKADQHLDIDPNAVNFLNEGKFYASFQNNLKGGSKPGGQPSGGAQGANPSPKAAGAAPAAVALGSPILPLAAMLPHHKCAQLEYLADPPENEDTIAKDSRHDVQFSLKSVAEVILYLGSELRRSPGHTFNSDDSIYFQLATADHNQPAPAHRMEVKYADGNKYLVGTAENDYTSEVIAILNELVNARKLSSDIATTKQVQVIP
jgi:hypothetical protein